MAEPLMRPPFVRWPPANAENQHHLDRIPDPGRHPRPQRTL